MINTVGIHDLAFKAPSLFLPIKDLAEARGIEPDKLKFGLGLENMSVCDVNEDVVSLAAGAVLQLLKQNPYITPDQIGRIYVGTESSIDGSKPIASYVHALINEHFSKTENVLCNTDVIDMTFACIGAIDAMHNSLYYLQSEPDKLAIVVATDIANYDLESSGEYTQGAGAVAVLLGANPRLLSIDTSWGVAMKSEHDFFKPIRLEQRAGKTVELHDEKPIFDGQFSNETYKNRITEAWSNYTSDKQISDYQQLVFHLPYAFHGRRIITSLLISEMEASGQLDTICEEFELDRNDTQFVRLFSKTPFYKNWVKQVIVPGEKYSSQMGNLYTASIFLSIMSSLCNAELDIDKPLLFFAYGSGSKAKVFEGKLSENYNAVISNWKVENELNERKAISFNQYENLRKNIQSVPLSNQSQIQQVASGILATNRFERTYEWIG
jgi:hydroxymethylglutaryl-CoA synthase